MKRSETNASRCVPMPYWQSYAAYPPGAVSHSFISELELKNADLMLHAVFMHKRPLASFLVLTSFV